MHFSHPIPVAALALTLVRLVNAVGSAMVTNKCGFPIYLWSVSNEQGPMVTLESNGGTFQEEYRLNPNGGGISIKIAPNDTLAGAITQLEYTLQSTLWYDVSNVNGSPFREQGLSVEASPPSVACKPVECLPGDACETQIYINPFDDFAVSACSPDEDLIMTICTAPKDAVPDSPPPAAPTPYQPTTSETVAPYIVPVISVSANTPVPAPFEQISQSFVTETTLSTAWVTAVQGVIDTITTSNPILPPQVAQSYVTDTTFSTAYFTAIENVIKTITSEIPAPTA
ncbi:hypothetical protein FH972_024525 [Carpinus fangiana]|uniref:Thaumatin-like protein n=1 Tax=Carpinus fangiana TaxID=176857 RepID=A0A5N6KYK8_9ROSI|nr:hypothetical protein FH972_024525 [Carpinus fangiana]